MDNLFITNTARLNNSACLTQLETRGGYIHEVFASPHFRLSSEIHAWNDEFMGLRSFWTFTVVNLSLTDQFSICLPDQEIDKMPSVDGEENGEEEVERSANEDENMSEDEDEESSLSSDESSSESSSKLSCAILADLPRFFVKF